MAHAWHVISVAQQEAGELAGAAFAASKESSRRIVAFHAMQTSEKLKLHWPTDEETNLKETKVRTTVSFSKRFLC